MTKVNSFIMESCKFLTVLLLYCVCIAYCYPSRPLNERSPELTWQAWLVVDDQNQNKHQTNAEGLLRRRITPKSVFIAPTFSPESLPPCAEGYNSDPMGRCIKIIKLDQEAHFAFLVGKIKEKFGPFDYEDEAEEEMTTPGPFQLNIPLAVDEGEEETDIAIIVTPTKAHFGTKTVNLDKRDNTDDENKQEVLLKKLVETTTKKNDETTSTEEFTTLIKNEETTITTDSDDLTTVTEPITTVKDDFITTTETRYIKRSTTDFEEEVPTTSSAGLPITFTESVTKTLPETTTPAPKVHTTPAPKIQAVQFTSPRPNFFRFPEEPKVRTLTNSFVKFPDTDISYQTQIPSSVELIPSTRDTHLYLNDRPASELAEPSVSEQRVVFRDNPQLEIANLDYSNGVQTQIVPTTTHRLYNRRNRDRHSLFFNPPRWDQVNFQKPVVLRFSRKHAYIDENEFKNADYYRSVPADDFAYLFKFKHKPLGHR